MLCTLGPKKLAVRVWGLEFNSQHNTPQSSEWPRIGGALSKAGGASALQVGSGCRLSPRSLHP